MVTITESAQDYLAELLGKQEDALGVRVFINQPGTPRAETCIAYCREGDVNDGDEEHQFEKFTAWFEGRSLPFLEDDSCIKVGSSEPHGRAAHDQGAQRQDAPGGPEQPAGRPHQLRTLQRGQSGSGRPWRRSQPGGGDRGYVRDTAIWRRLPGLFSSGPDTQLAGVRDTTDHTDRSQAYY